MNCDSSPVFEERTPSALAVRPRAAAKMLGIGTRKLWAMSQPRGPIPCVRLGKCVLYPIESLRELIAEELARGTRR